MTHIPCNQRKFILQVNHLTYVQQYYRWMKHLIDRIGYQNSLNVWNDAFKNYDHTKLNSIFSSGWNRVANSDFKIDEEIVELFSSFFSDLTDDNLQNHVKTAIESTPPFRHIEELFGNSTYEKEISAYDALYLRFDGQGYLAETMIEKFGKQGELIVYDIMIESRLAATGGDKGSVEDFIEDFTSLPPGRNLFSAGLEIDVIHKTKTEAIVHVKECEWARYFRDHHPNVGYLMACSTDEVAYKAINREIRMQRTETLMEGGDKCDFRIYSV